MAVYEYRCEACGKFESDIPANMIQCRCGRPGKRRFVVQLQAASARHRGRWDPQVGAYVENERQFRTLLRQGQEAQSERLGMECKLELVDARDHSALAELHGHSVEDRMADLEPTRAAAKAKAVT